MLVAEYEDRWEVTLKRNPAVHEKQTHLTRRNPNKPTVVYEWSLSQFNGDDVKLSDSQMRQIIELVTDWYKELEEGIEEL